jgi:hypothetical protein
MERRNFLKTVASGALTVGISPLSVSTFANNQAGQSLVSGTTDEDVIVAEPPLLLNDTSFFWVRGFNYQPGYNSSNAGGYDDGTGWSIWRNLRIDIIERELTRGVELFPEMTAVRIWLPYNVYLAQPKQFLKDFAKVINVIGKLKLRAMVVLFNAWGWDKAPTWGSFSPQSFPQMTKEEINRTFRFADALLERHGNDDRIFAWDLCNEPDLNGYIDTYFSWLEQLHHHIKARKEKTCLTIGSCGGPGLLKKIEPICDLFSIHPYYNVEWAKSPENYGNSVNEQVKVANEAGKAILATEIGWGNNDDAIRVETINIELSKIVERKVGFLIHGLNHSLVADLHRPEYGPKGVGFMGCIEKDGSMRPGHEKIREYLRAK